MDADENQYLRSCEYSGQKDNWKEVIKEQLIKHLKDIGVEPGFIRSEIRYFDVSPDYPFTRERYEIKLLDIIAKIKDAPC